MIYLILFLLLVNASSAIAQVKWTLEVLSGDAFCFRTPLTITQDGYDDIHLSAKYRTNSLELPIYYSVRIAKQNPDRAWELEFIHLKIKLESKSSEIRRFEISHGFNLLMVNHRWKCGEFYFRCGGGIVIAHPENIVRGKSLSGDEGIFNKGYYIAGPVVQVSIDKRFVLIKKLLLLLEGKFTGSYAKVPVVAGSASVSNAAIHGLLGLGYEF